MSNLSVLAARPAPEYGEEEGECLRLFGKRRGKRRRQIERARLAERACMLAGKAQSDISQPVFEKRL